MNDIKFNDVSMSYKSLLDDLWRKGFTLISAEHYKCLVEGKELTKTELDEFYSRMNSLKEMLNDVKVCKFEVFFSKLAIIFS